MLRKTAAIAVLILILSSFTLGSPVQIQTVAATGNEGDAPEQSTQEWSTAAFPPAAGFVGAVHDKMMAGPVGPGFVQPVPDTEDARQPVAGFFSASHVNRMADASISEGIVENVPDTGYSTLVVYLNDSRIERVAPGKFSFAVPGEGELTRAAGGAMIRPDHLRDNLTITSRLSLFRPGGTPEFYEFLWMRAQAGKPLDAGSMVVFSGHIMIPGHNGSSAMASPIAVDYGSAAGAIEFSGDMVVDLAHLPVDVATADDAVQTDDTYNNQIAAGQTNWHSASVDSAVEAVNVDLKWKNPDGKLRLVVYTPDGKVLGPFYDDSDGKTDGRINLNIANPSGVASGEWKLKVTDMTTLGSDDYYVKTY